MATGIFAFGSSGVVPCLLDFFIKCLLGIIQLQGIVFTLQACRAYPVTGRETVENRYAEVESYIFVEVIVHLLAESTVDGRIVIRTETTVQAQLRVVVALGNTDIVFTAFQAELCSLYGKPYSPWLFWNISSGGVRGTKSRLTAGDSRLNLPVFPVR